MNRILVSSSQILSAGYDALTSILEIEFQNGEIYQYYDVPPHVYESLLNAPSKSTYFDQRIKSDYRFEKLFT